MKVLPMSEIQRKVNRIIEERKSKSIIFCIECKEPNYCPFTEKEYKDNVLYCSNCGDNILGHRYVIRYIEEERKEVG